jgi:hypothetical protein
VTSTSRQRRAARRDAQRRGLDPERAIEKFGAAADQRTTDRRQNRSPDETERILRELGISDRRRQDRRRR